MNLDETRRRARITAYTFEDGVEHRYPAFPFAAMTIMMSDLAEAVAKFRTTVSGVSEAFANLIPPASPVTLAQVEAVRGGFTRKRNP